MKKKKTKNLKRRPRNAAKAGKSRPRAGMLPAPSSLVKKKARVHVNLTLEESTVAFFRKIAKKHRAKYQALIRELLDRYAGQYR